MTNLEIFLKARQLLEDPQNWWRGLRSPGCQVTMHCLQTAVGYVGGYSQDDNGRVDGAFSLVRDIIGTRDIPAWNDHCDRTHAEVVAVIDEAILRESQKVFKGKI